MSLGAKKVLRYEQWRGKEGLNGQVEWQCIWAVQSLTGVLHHGLGCRSCLCFLHCSAASWRRHCHFASALKYLPQAIQFLSPAMGVYLSKFRHFDFNVAISPWKGFLLVSKVNPISLICNSEMQKNPWKLTFFPKLGSKTFWHQNLPWHQRCIDFIYSA
jgi:hypothetical protein